MLAPTNKLVRTLAFDLATSTTTPSASNFSSLLWDDGGAGGAFNNTGILQPTYTPPLGFSGVITLTLTVNGSGSCVATNDAMTLTVYANPTIDAGSDEETCQDLAIDLSTATVPANGTNFLSLSWDDGGAGGSFDDNTLLQPTYTPPVGFAGNITLTLTANGNGSCAPVNDNMNLAVTAEPTVDAGSDEETCQDIAFDLSTSGTTPSAANFSSLSWTDGAAGGSFDDNTALQPIYTPPVGFSGTITLTLTGNGNGSCGANNDAMLLTVTAEPTIDAGSDEETCQDEAFNLAGSVTLPNGSNYSSVSWDDGGAGGSFNDNTLLLPTYTPPAAFSGAITLTITANGNGSCAPANDNMILTVTTAPIIDAGSDEETCEDVPFVSALSTIPAFGLNYSGLTWDDGAAGGSFDDATALNPTYTPPLGFSGVITLTVIADGNGSCLPASDFMTLIVTAAPTAFAGNDRTICYGDSIYIDDAAVSNNLDIVWTTLGDGTFLDGIDDIIDPTYIPGPADRAAGTVQLQIEATGNGSCASTFDIVDITIPSQLNVSVGSPTPFTISASTKITVDMNVEIFDGVSAITDFSYSLVAPDDTEISLRADAGWLILAAPPANLQFVTENSAADSALYNILYDGPNPGVQFGVDISGTYAADGDWTSIYGLDPANGNWRIRITDNQANGGVGLVDLVSGAISFRDTNAFGDTITLNYATNTLNQPIIDPDFAPLSTDFSPNLGLRETCPGACDALALVTVSGGTMPVVDYNWSPLPDSGNGTDSVFLCAGTYDLTVTDDFGCTATTSVEVAAAPAIAIDTIIYSDTLNCNGDLGYVRVDASGGYGSLQFTVDGGTTFTNVGDTVFNVDPSAPILVSVSDGSCSFDTTITMFEPASLAIDSVLTTNIACAGDGTGTITMFASGANTPYTYWIPGVDTNNVGAFNSLTAGAYSIFVTDAFGCDTLQFDTTLLEAAPLAIDTLIVDPFTCSDSEASATIRVNGGTAPYELTTSISPFWIPIPDSSYTTPAKTASDTFYFEIRDANGCTIESDTVKLFKPSNPISIDSLNVVPITTCFGDNTGAIFVTAQGGVAPYEYKLGVNGVYQSDSNFTGLSGGRDTVFVRDSYNCEIELLDTVILEPAALTVDSVVVAPISCNGADNGRIILYASGGSGALKYWIDPIADTNATGDFSNLGPNTYDIYVTDAGACDTIQVTRTITEPTALTLDNLIVNDVVCSSENASVFVELSGGRSPYFYNIDAGPNIAVATDTFTISPILTGGTYALQLLDANLDAACAIDTSFTITVPTSITLDTVIITDVECNGEANGGIEIAVSGGEAPYTFILASVDTNSSGNFTGLTAGTYSAYVQDNRGCLQYLFDTTVTQPGPMLSVAVPTIADLGNNGTVTIQVSGGVAPYVFAIEGPVSDTTLPILAINHLFTDLSIGLYNYSVTDVNGCQAIGSFEIRDLEDLNPTFFLSSDSTECFQLGGVTLRINPFTDIIQGTESIFFQMYTNGLQLPPVYDSATITVGEYLVEGILAGNYWLYAESLESGRTWDTIFTISEPEAINIGAVVKPTTCQEDLSSDGAINVTVAGGNGLYEYAWSTGDTTEDISNLAEGFYSLTVTDQKSCTRSTFFTVNRTDSIWVVAGNDQVVCPEENALITGIVSSGGLEYNWSPGKYVVDSTALTTNVVFTDTNIVTLLLTVSIDTLCSVSDEVIIEQQFIPEMIVRAEDDGELIPVDTVGVISSGEILLSATAGFDFYTWFPVDPLNINDLEGTMDDILSQSVYYVPGNLAENQTETWRVIGELNTCLDTAFVTLLSIREPEEGFSGFTPNGDGINDYWVIENANQLGDINILVFNRWGDKVFEHSGPYTGDNRWDGKYNNKYLPIGTYFYIITLTDGSGSVLRGTVTIMR
jgi:gliding motility-associated-like protein